MVSKMIKNLSPSRTLTLTEKITALKKEGHDILAFNLGEPDFNTPERVIKAAENAMKRGFTKYTPVAGVPALREAVCKKLADDNGLRYKPQQICVSTGAKQALINSAMAVCNPGDEVIIFSPCWVSYVEIVKIAGAVPVIVETREDGGFQPKQKDLERAITSKTKAVLVNSPNNPTGAIYSEAAIRMITETAEKHRLVIISDEIYEKLIYSEEKPFSPAAASDYAYENTITINGLSKSHAMTGWRIGYTAAPDKIAQGIAALQSHTTSNANTIAQYAAITALEDCSADIQIMKKAFNERRKYLFERLKSIRGIECIESRGAFYMMPNVSSFYGQKTPEGAVISDSTDFCEYILAAASIAIVPGDAFHSPANVRISYAASLDSIKKGMDAFEGAVNLIR